MLTGVETKCMRSVILLSCYGLTNKLNIQKVFISLTSFCFCNDLKYPEYLRKNVLPHKMAVGDGWWWCWVVCSQTLRQVVASLMLSMRVLKAGGTRRILRLLKWSCNRIEWYLTFEGQSSPSRIFCKKGIKSTKTYNCLFKLQLCSSLVIQIRCLILF